MTNEQLGNSPSAAKPSSPRTEWLTYVAVVLAAIVLLPLVWARFNNQWRLTVTMDGKTLPDDAASFACVTSTVDVRISSNVPLVGLRADQGTAGRVSMYFPREQDGENSWRGKLTLTHFGLENGAVFEIKGWDTHQRLLTRIINLIPPRVPYYHVALPKGFAFPKDSGCFLLLNRSDTKDSALASYYVGAPTVLTEDQVLRFTSAVVPPGQKSIWVAMEVLPHGAITQELRLDKPSSSMPFAFGTVTLQPTFTVKLE